MTTETTTSHLFLKGILLVAGTSIGGGMLALPVLTGQTGFIPSLLVFFLCWLFMASTGILLLETCTALPKEANIISMAEFTLGKFGKGFAWVTYLFLFYSLTLAYIVGCGDLIVDLFQGSIPEWFGSFIFIIIFSPMVFIGAKLIGALNLYLMIGLITSYLAFVFIGISHINTTLLSTQNWNLIFSAFPIAFTAFAYQGMIPTLLTYMNHDVKKTKWVIIIGSFLPLLVYALWQALILGIVPIEGPGGLLETAQKGQNAISPLKSFIQHPYIYLIGRFFAFFALLTSFFGVALGLLDFLADGLKIKKTNQGKAFLCALIFLPPFLISLVHPGLFLIALDYAGGYGCALLLGLLPILMVWSKRYYLHFKTEKLLPGEKILLSFLIGFVLFELTCQIFF